MLPDTIFQFLISIPIHFLKTGGTNYYLTYLCQETKQVCIKQWLNFLFLGLDMQKKNS